MRISDETHERCEGCGQMFVVVRSLGADLRPTRCPDCVAQTTTTMTPAAKRTPAGESFSIHSLVGDTTSPSASNNHHQQPGGHRSKPSNSSSKSSSPFLVQAAAAHAQYYALAASGLLPALNYGGRSTRVATMPPLDWASSPGIAAKHRYGV